MVGGGFSIKKETSELSRFNKMAYERRRLHKNGVQGHLSVMVSENGSDMSPPHSILRKRPINSSVSPNQKHNYGYAGKHNKSMSCKRTKFDQITDERNGINQTTTAESYNRAKNNDMISKKKQQKLAKNSPVPYGFSNYMNYNELQNAKFGNLTNLLTDLSNIDLIKHDNSVLPSK